MIVDLNSFVEKRREERAKKKKKMKFYLCGVLGGLILFIFLIISVFLKNEKNYQIRLAEENITKVKFVENLKDINNIRTNEEKKYYIQADALIGEKEWDEVNKKLNQAGIGSYISKEGKVLKITLIESFETIEEAEKFADELKSKKLLKAYSVRVR